MIRSITLAAAALVASASMAAAADLYIPETPIAYDEATGFDWSGAYIGGNVSGYFQDDLDAQIGLGAALGYNFQPIDPIVLGLELQGNYLFENDDIPQRTQLSLMGRAGVLVTDDILVYASGSIGQEWNADADDSYGIYSLGAGVELAVTDNMTVRGDIAAVAFEDDDDFSATTASVGAFFHF